MSPKKIFISSEFVNDVNLDFMSLVKNMYE